MKSAIVWATRLTVLFVVSLTLSSCNRTKEPEGLPLLGPFESFSSVQNVIKQLAPASVWKLSKTQLSKDSQSEVATLEINNIQIYRENGRLKLTFWNDQLESATFYPDRYDQFLLRYRETVGTGLTTNEQKLNGEIHGLADRDDRGIGFVYIKDERLSRTRHDWLMTHS